MAELKRITPEEVLKALTENELTPHQEVYTDVVSDKNCACGLSALVIGMGNGFAFVNAFDSPENFIFDTLVKDGFESGYLNGFIFGFDNRETMYATTDKIQTIGISDGIAAWEAVKHLALPEDDE